jgi:FMN phosphatase YigB (HAD superfamily)
MDLLDADTILCDIDATVTDVADGHSHDGFRDAVFGMFARHIAAARNVSEETALSLLNDFADNLMVWWDYPDFITNFGLDAERIWREMREIHSSMLRFYGDAVEMIKYLKSIDKDLFIISNNPVTGCLLKLELAELADLRGTTYFNRIFGTNITHGMKSQVPMWKRVIASLGGDVKNMVTIGDNVKEDFMVPREAGIINTIIVDRNADIPVSEKAGYICVNSLSEVKELIR